MAGTSSSDLTPDETTSARVCASACRSAETSGGVGQPRWTPPRPPVAMKWMPAALQTASVPPTVVAPTAPCTTAAARSRGPSLRADSSNRASSPSVSPMWISSSSTPIVAGTAPPSRTACSDARPTSMPSPGGNPCAIRVVSRATTPRPSRSACSICGETIRAVLPPASLRAARSSVPLLRARARARRSGTRPRARRLHPSCRRPSSRPPGSRDRRR